MFLWHYHNDNPPAPPVETALTLRGLLAARVSVQHYRVDKEHGDAYAARHGLAPASIGAQQAALEQAGPLLAAPAWVSTQNGWAVLHFALPRQGVLLLRLG